MTRLTALRRLEALAARGGDVAGVRSVLTRLERLGVNMDDVGWALETQGVAAFRDSFAHVLGALGAKAGERAA